MTTELKSRNINANKVPLYKRCMSFMIDLMLIGWLVILIDKIINPEVIEARRNIAYIGFTLIVLRDTSYGIVTKFLLGYKVVSVEKYGFVRLILRNLTLFIYPIEFLLLLLKKKRLGDLIAKTNVSKIESQDTISSIFLRLLTK